MGLSNLLQDCSNMTVTCKSIVTAFYNTVTVFFINESLLEAQDTVYNRFLNMFKYQLHAISFGGRVIRETSVTSIQTTSASIFYYLLAILRTYSQHLSLNLAWTSPSISNQRALRHRLPPNTTDTWHSIFLFC